MTCDEGVAIATALASHPYQPQFFLGGVLIECQTNYSAGQLGSLPRRPRMGQLRAMTREGLFPKTGQIWPIKHPMPPRRAALPVLRARVS